MTPLLVGGLAGFEVLVVSVLWRQWWRHRPPRVAPVNAQAHLRDGSAVALDLRFVGREGGVDVWQSLQVLPFGSLVRITADELPGRCAIQVQLEHPL